MSLESRYRRMLRPYPASWRRTNEEALVGLLLDEAEARSQTKPRFVERASAALHGSAARLNARFVIVCSLGAIALASAFMLLGFFEAPSLYSRVSNLVMAGVVPALVAVATIAALRIRGRLSDGSALAAAALAMIALALMIVLRFGLLDTWDEATETVVTLSSRNVFSLVPAAAEIAGAAAIALVLNPLMRRQLPWRALRIPFVVATSIVAPVLCAVLTTMHVAMGALALIPLGMVARSQRVQQNSPRTPRHAIAHLLEAGALTICLYGAFTMATGIRRIPFGIELPHDDVLRGLLFMLAGGVPLITAQGLRSTRPAWSAVSLGIGSVLLAGMTLATNYSSPWLMLASAGCGAVAIALWLTPATGLIFSIAAAALYASGIGAMLTPALGIVVAVASLAATATGFRRHGLRAPLGTVPDNDALA